MPTYVKVMPTYVNMMPTYVKMMLTYVKMMPICVKMMPTCIKMMQTYVVTMLNLLLTLSLQTSASSPDMFWYASWFYTTDKWPSVGLNQIDRGLNVSGCLRINWSEATRKGSCNTRYHSEIVTEIPDVLVILFFSTLTYTLMNYTRHTFLDWSLTKNMLPVVTAR